MDITIIVATYNQESTIGRTLDSILCQTTSASYEILIVDDCSTDNTGIVCSRYAAENPNRVRYIRRQSNMGLVANYIDAIQQARGRYIADCAGDDFWIDSTKLQSQFDILENNPNVTLVHTAWQCYNPVSGTISRPPFRPEDYPQYFSYLVPGNRLITPLVAHKLNPLVHLCTAMYRRDIVIKAIDKHPELFNSPWLTCEDLQIATALASEGSFCYLPIITLNYTVSDNSISKPTLPDKAFRYHAGVWRLVRQLQKIHNIPQKDLDSFYRKQASFLTKLMFNTNDPLLRRQTKELLGKRFRHTDANILLSSNRLLWNISLKTKNALKNFLQ